MGYIAHHAVIVTISAYALDEKHRPAGAPGLQDIEQFRENLPEDFRHLLVGPIGPAINDYYTVVFVPDGSKEEWEHSDTGDEIRRSLIEMFSWTHEDGSSPYDVVELRFGGDDPELASLVHVGKVGADSEGFTV